MASGSDGSTGLAGTVVAEEDGDMADGGDDGDDDFAAPHLTHCTVTQFRNSVSCAF